MGFSKIVASLDSTLCRSILKSNASSPTDQPITFTLSPALMSGDFPHHHGGSEFLQPKEISWNQIKKRMCNLNLPAMLTLNDT